MVESNKEGKRQMEASPTLDAVPGEKPSLAVLPWLDHRYFLLIAFLSAVVVYSQIEVFKQPVRGDRANWEYMAQLIARGGVPYRDAVNIKSPLSAYLGAAAIVITRPFGLRDVYAVRLLYQGLGVLTVVFTFLVAYVFFKSRRLALLAALIFLSFQSFAGTNSAGIQPKTPMMLFGLCSLWSVGKSKPFWAGLFSMLSALSWQPGLLFFGAAFLAFTGYLTLWPWRRLIQLIGGTAIPLAILLVYFGFVGALDDFYLWAFKYNYSVYAPEELKSVSHFFRYFGRMLAGYPNERIYFLLAALGILVALGREVLETKCGGIRALRDRAPIHALTISLLVYFAFCIVNVQGSADFLPFLPYIGIFAALGIIAALDGMTALVQRSRVAQYRVHFKVASAVVVISVILYFNLSHAFSYHRRGLTLQAQEAEIKEITSHLQPGDRIFVHGSTEVLVLAGLTNSSPHFFLDRNKDLYLNQVEPGGFDGWFDRLKADQPKVVLLSRLRKVKSKKQFIDWVASDYDEHRGKNYTYYVRKSGVGNAVVEH
jgi:hypothetical protein